MASVVFTGTATDYADFLEKIIGHLTGAGMGSQAWTLLKTEGVNRYLRGPGLSGTDSIHINLATYADPANDNFGMWSAAAIGFNTLNSWANQPGKSPEVAMPLWDSVIPYWLIANGRRFIIVAKISTVYTSCYCGFILPYATSSEMPYPIVNMSSCNSPKRWSQGDFYISSFWDPTGGSAYLRFWDGAWVSIENFISQTTRSELSANAVWPFHSNYGLGTNRDGSYGILPAIIHGAYSSKNIFGELESVFQVSGFSNASEDIITIGADQYLVVQSAYRNSDRDYAAIKLG